MRKLSIFFTCLLLCGLFIYFIPAKNGSSTSAKENTGKKNDFVLSEQKNIRELLFDSVLCDGFDFPVGDKDGKGGYTSLLDGKHYDSWYVATKTGEEYYLGIHTGEDWNGSGGGNTDLGQPVYATAEGIVVHAAECPSPWGNVIMIEHHYIENGEPKMVYSQYSHLKELYVKKGDHVERRQKIAAIGQGNHQEYPAHLHFEIRYENMKGMDVDYWPSSHEKNVAWVKEHYADGSTFVKLHRSLHIPAREEKFAIVVKHEFK